MNNIGTMVLLTCFLPIESLARPCGYILDGDIMATAKLTLKTWPNNPSEKACHIKP